MKRPDINSIKTGFELKQWYWLKAELEAFAKEKGVRYTGSKFELLDRLADHLDGKGTTALSKEKVTSSFDWAKAELTLDTIITDSYTNGPNTRKFFLKHCGDRFAFSIPFMRWMKNNRGKTLRDAVVVWNQLRTKTSEAGHKSDIPVGNQYNQYIRDFFADNPGMTLKDAQRCWKLKRSLPTQRHIYEKSDLNLV
ncbi:MAG: DUF6434 domain-containing protein [Sphingobacteriales bacterium]|jgi:hypothetical protein